MFFYSGVHELPPPLESAPPGIRSVNILQVQKEHDDDYNKPIDWEKLKQPPSNPSPEWALLNDKGDGSFDWDSGSDIDDSDWDSNANRLKRKRKFDDISRKRVIPDWLKTMSEPDPHERDRMHDFDHDSEPSDPTRVRPRKKFRKRKFNRAASI